MKEADTSCRLFYDRQSTVRWSSLKTMRQHWTVLPLTVLALVSSVLRRAATGRLVAHIDRAVASVQTVVLTGVAVTGGPCEALWTSAGWSTWNTGKIWLKNLKRIVIVYAQGAAVHHHNLHPSQDVEYQDFATFYWVVNRNKQRCLHYTWQTSRSWAGNIWESS